MAFRTTRQAAGRIPAGLTSVNIESSVGQINAGNNWFQNVKAGGQQEKEKAAPQPQADAVKVSISQESYRKQLRESGLGGANGKVIAKEGKDSIIRQQKAMLGVPISEK